MPRICDYEGSHYRTEFWEAPNRTYEDAVERIAMKNMLPAGGHRLVEIGAGFGRMVDLYQGYRQIVLLDYARTQLQEAQRYLGNDERITYVVADVYNLPFVDNLFDTLTMVRVMHHLVDVPAALSEIHRIIEPNGTAVIEHASKRNLKAIFRWVLGLQHWSPFEPDPLEFVELNFNFHPSWMRQQFAAAGLSVTQIRTLSHYRSNTLKQLLPTSLLVTLDGWAQTTGNRWQLTPSIFLQAKAKKSAAASPAGFFQCPHCRSPHLIVTDHPAHAEYILTCQQCEFGWQHKDGIYDFKTPVKTPASSASPKFP